ncbi:hypothetical protein FF38_00603 [Lucilia cuprina]|uniref:Uncharacterized protein n=1 Tax=Lucilia cuprina TaxID=7375 RepID=A0A0L0CFJ9_LUCCU|nr:hypothetical protein FF38_00603 [Lucilia cuprina]
MIEAALYQVTHRESILMKFATRTCMTWLACLTTLSADGLDNIDKIKQCIDIKTEKNFYIEFYLNSKVFKQFIDKKTVSIVEIHCDTNGYNYGTSKCGISNVSTLFQLWHFKNVALAMSLRILDGSLLASQSIPTRDFGLLHYNGSLVITTIRPVALLTD